MTVDSTDSVSARDTEPMVLLDALLYSVSHDLRSPLLTMSLSADLIEEGLSGEVAGSPSRQRTALEALRHAATDLERMLQALTLLSRARRRQLKPASASLRSMLGGYDVTWESSPGEDHRVAVDLLPVRDLLDAMGDGEERRVRVAVHGDSVHLSVPEGDLEGLASPVHAVASALHRYAGTQVETAAVAQVLIERSGGVVRSEEGRLSVTLPLLRDPR